MERLAPGVERAIMRIAQRIDRGIRAVEHLTKELRRLNDNYEEYRDEEDGDSGDNRRDQPEDPV